METSNFAHVIFQNVGKSFLPQAPLECRYTLTPYITPHPKDWVGIFKVGWSTARDYYTFLWSPMPENYEPGSTVHRTVVFQDTVLTPPSHRTRLNTRLICSSQTSEWNSGLLEISKW
uniref:Tax1 (human T-cell leukemia virus type I) binding protein 1a n=1 Tax=Myripristis murdjan TaxID=586833 RepID=A0A667WL44_9TELE